MSTVTTYLNLVKPASPEQFSLATYNNNLDLVDTHLKDVVQKMAKGAVYQNNVVANSGAVSAIAVVNNIASFAFKAGRKYQIIWSFEYQGSVVNNYIDASIQTCSTADAGGLTTGLTKLGGSSLKVYDASVGHHGEASAWYNPVSDTTLQIKFTLLVWIGAGTAIIVASATQPARYTIIDHGAQY